MPQRFVRLLVGAILAVVFGAVSAHAAGKVGVAAERSGMQRRSGCGFVSGDLPPAPVYPGALHVPFFWTDPTGAPMFTGSGNALFFSGPANFSFTQLSSPDGCIVYVDIPAGAPLGTYVLGAENGYGWLSDPGTIVIAPIPSTPTPTPTATPANVPTLTLASQSGKDLVILGYNFETSRSYEVQVTDRTGGNVLPRWISPHVFAAPLPGGAVGISLRLPDQSYFSAVYDINIRNADGQWSNKVPLTVTPATLTSVTRAGASILLTGTNLFSAAHIVRFTNPATGAQTLAVSAAELPGGFTVLLPASVTYGAYRVAVSNAGSAWSNELTLNIVSSISGITPQSAPPGGTITIKGDGFAILNNIVEFSDEADPARAVVVGGLRSDRVSITVTVPDSLSAGAYRVRLTQLDGTSTNYGSLRITPNVIIAVSGLGTTSFNRYFSWLGDNFPTTPRIDIASGFYSPDSVTDKLRAAIERVLADGNRPLVISHSQGTAYAYAMQQAYKGKNVKFLFLDPPYDERLCNTLLGHIISWFRAVGTAANGLRGNPDAVIWTHGRGFEHLITHDPFDFPRMNAVNVANLRKLAVTIKKKLVQSCNTSCSMDGIDVADTYTPPPRITAILDSKGAPATSIYPGSGATVKIQGTGFSAVGNSLLLKSSADPAGTYYQGYDLTPDASGALTFKVPKAAFPPSTFTNGTFTIQIAALDSAWGDPFEIAVSLAPDVRSAVAGANGLVIIADGLAAKGQNYVRVINDATGAVLSRSRIAPNSAGALSLKPSSSFPVPTNYSVQLSIDGKNWSTAFDGLWAAAAAAAAVRAPDASDESARFKRQGSRTGSSAAAPSATRGCLDFDGDGISDATVAVSSKSALLFRTLLSSGALHEVSIASSNALPAPADYNGSGIAQYATVSAINDRTTWSIWNPDGSVRQIELHAHLDSALSGCDFDGDGRADAAGLSRGERRMYFVRSQGGKLDSLMLPVGTDGEIIAATCGDFDGNRGDMLALYIRERDGGHLRAIDTEGALRFERRVAGDKKAELFVRGGAAPELMVAEPLGSNARRLRFYRFADRKTRRPQLLRRTRALASVSDGIMVIDDGGAAEKLSFESDDGARILEEFARVPRSARPLGCVNSFSLTDAGR